MEIRLLEAEARAIDALCEEIYKIIDLDQNMTASEVKEKKEILDNFIKFILDKAVIVKDNPTISLKKLLVKDLFTGSFEVTNTPFITGPIIDTSNPNVTNIKYVYPCTVIKVPSTQNPTYTVNGVNSTNINI